MKLVPSMLGTLGVKINHKPRYLTRQRVIPPLRGGQRCRRYVWRQLRPALHGSTWVLQRTRAVLQRGRAGIHQKETGIMGATMTLHAADTFINPASSVSPSPARKGSIFSRRPPNLSGRAVMNSEGNRRLVQSRFGRTLEGLWYYSGYDVANEDYAEPVKP